MFIIPSTAANNEICVEPKNGEDDKRTVNSYFWDFERQFRLVLRDGQRERLLDTGRHQRHQRKDSIHN